eukprot:106963-Heterocapsa_arctica.AAC.1
MTPIALPKSSHALMADNEHVIPVTLTLQASLRNSQLTGTTRLEGGGGISYQYAPALGKAGITPRAVDCGAAIGGGNGGGGG